MAGAGTTGQVIRTWRQPAHGARLGVGRLCTGLFTRAILPSCCFPSAGSLLVRTGRRRLTRPAERGEISGRTLRAFAVFALTSHGFFAQLEDGGLQHYDVSWPQLPVNVGLRAQGLKPRYSCSPVGPSRSLANLRFCVSCGYTRGQLRPTEASRFMLEAVSEYGPAPPKRD
jgi:hypothetical protein